tara:strand:+ start:586 stop:909 length:324 start_codon:yes stop_codon:yes gene_type:complete
MIGRCFTCEDKVDVYLDHDFQRGADYCAKCLLANLTWAESRSGVYHFNKVTKHKLIALNLIALEMAKEHKRISRRGYMKWPENVEKVADDWFPELHEICHLAWSDEQ